MRRSAVLLLLLTHCTRPQTKPQSEASASSSVAVAVVAPPRESSDVVDFGPPSTPEEEPPPPSGPAIAPTKPSKMTPIPTGKVKELSMGNGHGCAIMKDDTIACWSEPDALFPLGTVPAGPFAHVAVGGMTTCAQALDGKVVCFGSPKLVPTPPSEPVVQMCHDLGPCVERSNRTATCYDRDGGPLSLGTIRPGSLTCGDSYSCALGPSGELKCVMMDRVMAKGSQYASPANWRPPAKSFDRIFSGYQHGCGLAADGTATCWGRDKSGETRPPAGPFKTLALGEKLSCGIRPNGDIECWGSRAGGPWKGPFKAVAPSTHHDRGNTLCAIKSDDTIACWPYES